jgi:isopenicillin-N epimerase
MRFQYCVHCRRWLCSAKGSAFLYARREMQHLLEPLVVSSGWQPEKTTLLTLDGVDASPFILQQEWHGTRDIAPYLSVPAAIDFQAEHDWPRVQAECHELVRYAQQAIGELTGLEQICPDSAEWFVQMVTIPLPSCDAGELKRRLVDEHRVAIPIIEWGGWQFVRASVQGYNSVADMEALSDALRALLPQARH